MTIQIYKHHDHKTIDIPSNTSYCHLRKDMRIMPHSRRSGRKRRGDRQTRQHMNTAHSYTFRHRSKTASSFDMSLITKPSNARIGMLNKPVGGLWLSVDGGWERWCEREMPQWLDGDAYDVTLSKDAQILIVDSIQEYKRLPRIEGDEEYIDYEEIFREYDAIQVMISQEPQLYMLMYGWDCDSMCIGNPCIIERMERT